MPILIWHNNLALFFAHYDLYLEPIFIDSPTDNQQITEQHTSSNLNIKQSNTKKTRIKGWKLIGRPTPKHTSDQNDKNSQSQPTSINDEYFKKLCDCLAQFDAKLKKSVNHDGNSNGSDHHNNNHKHDNSSQAMSRNDNQTMATFIPPPPAVKMSPIWSKADYQRAFERTQNYLYAGDCYQINLTQPWLGTLPTSYTLVDYLPNLYAHTQAPYAGYLSLPTFNPQTNTFQPHSNFELLSCSPELFLQFTTTNMGGHNVNIIKAKPIKGTIPRGHSQIEDDSNKQILQTSTKDCAENVMIVDLLRNDLGKYAKTGSVRVPHLFAIESFSNVHHLVSTIEAQLKTSIHPLTALFGSLPAGSITGTPKKRAVEIIDELEASTHHHARGAYCGSLGFLNFDGTGQFNVLIRTLQATTKASINTIHNHDTDKTSTDKTGQIMLWAGGGITVASKMTDEYQECWDKVGNLLAILGGSYQ